MSSREVRNGYESVTIYRTKDIAKAIGQLCSARELIAMAGSRLPTSSERDALYQVTSEPIKNAMSSLLKALMKAEGI